MLLLIPCMLFLKTLPLYNTFQVILQILEPIYKSSVIKIMCNVFRLPKPIANCAAQWSVTLCEQTYFLAGEAEKVKAAQASFSWKCSLFFGI